MSLFYAYFWLIVQLDLESRLEIIFPHNFKKYGIIFQIPGMLLRILILLYPFLYVCPDYFSLKVFRNFSLSLEFWNFTLIYLSEVSLKLNTFMKWKALEMFDFWREEDSNPCWGYTGLAAAIMGQSRGWAWRSSSHSIPVFCHPHSLTTSSSVFPENSYSASAVGRGRWVLSYPGCRKDP